jgi:hypothetical protein
MLVVDVGGGCWWWMLVGRTGTNTVVLEDAHANGVHGREERALSPRATSPIDHELTSMLVDSLRGGVVSPGGGGGGSGRVSRSGSVSGGGGGSGNGIPSSPTSLTADRNRMARSHSDFRPQHSGLSDRLYSRRTSALDVDLDNVSISSVRSRKL